MYLVRPIPSAHNISHTFLKTNLLEWHWIIKLNRFQMYDFMTHHLYVALCAHHPKSNLPSPYIWSPSLWSMSFVYLFFLVCSFVAFSFISCLWVKAYGSWLLFGLLTRLSMMLLQIRCGTHAQWNTTQSWGNMKYSQTHFERAAMWNFTWKGDRVTLLGRTPKNYIIFLHTKVTSPENIQNI